MSKGIYTILTSLVKKTERSRMFPSLLLTWTTKSL